MPIANVAFSQTFGDLVDKVNQITSAVNAFDAEVNADLVTNTIATATLSANTSVTGETLVSNTSVSSASVQTNTLRAETSILTGEITANSTVTTGTVLTNALRSETSIVTGAINANTLVTTDQVNANNIVYAPEVVANTSVTTATLNVTDIVATGNVETDYSYAELAEANVAVANSMSVGTLDTVDLEVTGTLTFSGDITTGNVTTGILTANSIAVAGGGALSVDTVNATSIDVQAINPSGNALSIGSVTVTSNLNIATTSDTDASVVISQAGASNTLILQNGADANALSIVFTKPGNGSSNNIYMGVGVDPAYYVHVEGETGEDTYTAVGAVGGNVAGTLYYNDNGSFLVGVGNTGPGMAETDRVLYTAADLPIKVFTGGVRRAEFTVDESDTTRLVVTGEIQQAPLEVDEGGTGNYHRLTTGVRDIVLDDATTQFDDVFFDNFITANRLFSTKIQIELSGLMVPGNVTYSNPASPVYGYTERLRKNLDATISFDPKTNAFRVEGQELIGAGFASQTTNWPIGSAAASPYLIAAATSLKTVGSVSDGTNTFTVTSHGMSDGARILLSINTGGLAPGGTTNNQIYFANTTMTGTPADEFKIFETLEGALAGVEGTEVDITSSGSNVRFILGGGLVLRLPNSLSALASGNVANTGSETYFSIGYKVHQL